MQGSSKPKSPKSHCIMIKTARWKQVKEPLREPSSRTRIIAITSGRLTGTLKGPLEGTLKGTQKR